MLLLAIPSHPLEFVDKHPFLASSSHMLPIHLHAGLSAHHHRWRSSLLAYPGLLLNLHLDLLVGMNKDAETSTALAARRIANLAYCFCGLVPLPHLVSILAGICPGFGPLLDWVDLGTCTTYTLVLRVPIAAAFGVRNSIAMWVEMD